MTPEERAKEFDQAELAAFTLIGWSKKSASNGYTAKALEQAQSALAIAQAVDLLKKPAA
jgi:hypothetical protein